MKKNFFILAAFIFMFCVSKVNAQVTFPAGTNLCETTPWKLVWYDEFDGTSINTNKWFTFLDDGNWGPNGVIVPPVSQGSRTMNRGSNFMDANVVVSSGTCKLIAKYEPNIWINSVKLYTSGVIKARKNDANGNSTPMYFNKGKFEMRARISKAEKIWAAYWLWVGGNSSYGPGGSEIDMFEYMPINNSETSTNSFGFHGWDRGPGWPVSPDCTSDGNSFEMTNIDNWHVYSCEWDQNFVRLSIDGILKFTKDRYKLSNGTGYYGTGNCAPNSSSTYYIDPTATFPYPDEYLSFICSMDYRDNIGTGQPDRTWEIDYVRIYQRTPQSDLKDVCSHVTGPTSICLNVPTTYYLTVGEGTFTNWTVSSNMQVLSSGTSNGQPYITVKGIGNGMSWISPIILNKPASCPMVDLQVSVGTPNPQSPTITTTATSNPGKKSITISFPAPPSGVTYTWHVSSTGGAVFDGTNAGSRTFLMLNGDIFSYWIYATTACGESDELNLGYKLVNGVLQPYVLEKPANPFGHELRQGIDLIELPENSQNNNNISIFPNPVTNILSVDMNRNYEDVTIKIVDMAGRSVYLNNYTQVSKISVDVSQYTSGTYYVSIQDKNGDVFQNKFIKK